MTDADTTPDGAERGEGREKVKAMDHARWLEDQANKRLLPPNRQARFLQIAACLRRLRDERSEELVAYRWRFQHDGDDAWRYRSYYPEVPNAEVQPVYARTALEAEGEADDRR